MKKALLLLASILVLKTVDSQVIDSTLWMQYMLESPPNYYKVKNAFYAYWGDSIPARSYGYKAFKRWEWRALEYLLTGNLGEVLLIGVGVVVAGVAALTPLQLLWINLVTDGLPALFLALPARS